MTHGDLLPGPQSLSYLTASSGPQWFDPTHFSLYFVLPAFTPDIVGITATTPEYPFAFTILSKIKEKNLTVVSVLGGAHITNLPDHMIEDMDSILDWGVIYEGEKPMLAIADGNPEQYAWMSGKSPKLLMAEARLTGEELSDFTPARDGLDMTRYRFVDTSPGMVQNDALEAARGCPFACSFCTSRKTLLAPRSLESILEEMVDSAKKFNTKLFMFFDDTFAIDKRVATEMFKRIIALKKSGRLPSDVHFYGFTRANTLHDTELLLSMQEAGCDKISIGVETGNAGILKSTEKGTKLDDYRKAYALMDQLNITKRGSFIIGHPYETEETIWDSINFAIELDLDEIGVNIMTPYPGQVTFRDALEGKGIWLSHKHQYAEFQNLDRGNEAVESWNDFQNISWHEYWKNHLRWGSSVIETETLSGEALRYWHGRFLQEVYGSENMAKRRQRFLDNGNDDEYWHRPWRVNVQRNKERIEKESREGRPTFPSPMHLRYYYHPVVLQDYQKNELVMSPSKREALAREAVANLVPLPSAGSIGARQ